MEDAELKLCSQCKESRPLTGFSKYRKSKDGHHPTCRTCKSAWQKKRFHKSRLEVMQHYCKGEIKCQCPGGCDVSDLMFLTIDHIDEDGAEHRRSIGKGTWTLYWWLRKNGFPDGYRVLCYNCNCGRYRNNNRCPHEDRVAR